MENPTTLWEANVRQADILQGIVAATISLYDQGLLPSTNDRPNDIKKVLVNNLGFTEGDANYWLTCWFFVR
jgi:hypothetical protein